MENYFLKSVENSKRAVKYWWLLAAVGVLVCLAGVLVFIFPAEAYLSLSLIFGLLILGSGVATVVVSGANVHYVTSRGWMLVGGLIELVLGLVLCFNPSLTASALPYFLGFWLLFRSFGMIGLGFDMLSVKLNGAGSTLVFGFLALSAAFIILFQPIGAGTSAVVLWVGLSFLFTGFSLLSFAWQLKDFHLTYQPRQ